MTYLSSSLTNKQPVQSVLHLQMVTALWLEKKETAKLHLHLHMHITITKAKSHKKATSSLLTLGPTSTAGLAVVDRGSRWTPAGVIPGSGVMGAQRSSARVVV